MCFTKSHTLFLNVLERDVDFGGDLWSSNPQICLSGSDPVHTKEDVGPPGRWKIKIKSAKQTNVYLLLLFNLLLARESSPSGLKMLTFRFIFSPVRVVLDINEPRFQNNLHDEGPALYVQGKHHCVSSSVDPYSIMKDKMRRQTWTSQVNM